MKDQKLKATIKIGGQRCEITLSRERAEQIRRLQKIIRAHKNQMGKPSKRN